MYWGEAIVNTMDTWNATAGNKKTPLEHVSGRKGDLQALKPFGCHVFIRKDENRQAHLESRTVEGIFLGYSAIAKGYRVSCDAQWKSVIIRAPCDCRFKEDEFPATEQKMKKSDELRHGDSNN